MHAAHLGCTGTNVECTSLLRRFTWKYLAAVLHAVRSPRMGEQCVSELPTFSRRPQGAGTPNAGIRAHAERVSDGLRTENLERPEGTVDQWLGCTVSPLGSSLLHSSRQPFDAKMMNQSHTGEQSYFIPCVHQVQPFG